MASRATHLIPEGVPFVQANAAGVQAAFLTGAIISVFAIPYAFSLRKPVEV